MAGSANVDVLVPAWFACRRLRIPKQTFHSWVVVGKLKPRAVVAGQPRYRYGDVLAVERETRNSRKSARNPRRRDGLTRPPASDAGQPLPLSPYPLPEVPMPNAVEPHDWHLLDAERGIEARQRTDATQANQWETRDAAGRHAVLDDDEFDRLRTGDWLPEELR